MVCKLMLTADLNDMLLLVDITTRILHISEEPSGLFSQYKGVDFQMIRLKVSI